MGKPGRPARSFADRVPRPALLTTHRTAYEQWVKRFLCIRQLAPPDCRHRAAKSFLERIVVTGQVIRLNPIPGA